MGGGSRPSPPPGTFTWNEVRKAMKISAERVEFGTSEWRSSRTSRCNQWTF
ncbi:hypothetical protein PSHT_01180 [Puccinia striiformis]|uniref:Uncharacterized protein n=2 Tax=Puccinia striiformis TaxID=27350 RepID=A0A2S4W2Y6_9BASI|nr:hypothetical protein PSTT_01669 [Puccinia striiformis]POW22527.1 hypothetical protein PSHT_01180 [Puccinia striiformis]